MAADRMKQQGKGTGSGAQSQEAPGRGPMDDRLMRGKRGLHERQRDYLRQDDRARRAQVQKQGNLPPERNR